MIDTDRMSSADTTPRHVADHSERLDRIEKAIAEIASRLGTAPIGSDETAAALRAIVTDVRVSRGQLRNAVLGGMGSKEQHKP